MLRSMLLIVLLAFCFLAVPVTTHAQELVNLVLNPSFEDEADLMDGSWTPDGWEVWGEGDGLDSVVEFDKSEFIDGKRSAHVKPTGTVDWHFMIIYFPVALDMGESYTTSFWAKAEEDRTIAVHMKDVDNAGSFGLNTFTITTEWAEYTYTDDAEWPNIKLEIFVSGSDIPLWFDFVYIYEGDYVEGILPSEMSAPGAVEPADKLSVRWAEIKTSR